MPGISTPLLKSGMASAKQKRKDHDQQQRKLSKTIHIIYTDPDLTDPSSDDEEGKCGDKLYTSSGVKRCFKKVRIFESLSNAKENPEKNVKLPSQNVLDRNGMMLKSKYVGVRMRKWGKWSAEIRDHVLGIRKWLGSHDTEEEAHFAYERQKLEFQALKEQKKVKTSKSPSSVLDVSSTDARGGNLKANDSVKKPSSGFINNEVKEEKFDTEDRMKPDIQEHVRGDCWNSGFCDDYKMIFDELKEEDFLMCHLGDLADHPDSSSLLDLDKQDFSWLDEVLHCVVLTD